MIRTPILQYKALQTGKRKECKSFLFCGVLCGLCIRVGRGHRDVCVGTWDLRTRDEGLKEIKYGTRGSVGRGRGDVKNRDAGDEECE